MTLTTKEKDLITYYDLGECISEQIYYFVNHKQEFCVSILLDEDKNPNEITDKQIEEHFYNDYCMKYGFDCGLKKNNDLSEKLKERIRRNKNEQED